MKAARSVLRPWPFLRSGEQFRYRLAYGLILSATALIALAVSLHIEAATHDPASAKGMRVPSYLRDPVIMPAALLGPFLAGVLTWRPIDRRGIVADTLWLTFIMIGVSFWMIALVGSVQIALMGIGGGPFWFFFVKLGFGVLFAASLYGVFGYPIGFILIALLRGIDRSSAPQANLPARLDRPKSRYDRIGRVVLTILATVPLTLTAFTVVEQMFDLISDCPLMGYWYGACSPFR